MGFFLIPLLAPLLQCFGSKCKMHCNCCWGWQFDMDNREQGPEVSLPAINVQIDGRKIGYADTSLVSPTVPVPRGPMKRSSTLRNLFRRRRTESQQSPNSIESPTPSRPTQAEDTDPAVSSVVSSNDSDLIFDRRDEKHYNYHGEHKSSDVLGARFEGMMLLLQQLEKRIDLQEQNVKQIHDLLREGDNMQYELMCQRIEEVRKMMVLIQQDVAQNMEHLRERLQWLKLEKHNKRVP